jgi:hypothetical protein
MKQPSSDLLTRRQNHDRSQVKLQPYRSLEARPQAPQQEARNSLQRLWVLIDPSPERPDQRGRCRPDQGVGQEVVPGHVSKEWSEEGVHRCFAQGLGGVRLVGSVQLEVPLLDAGGNAPQGEEAHFDGLPGAGRLGSDTETW